MTHQDTKTEPCTILEGPWRITVGPALDAPHCNIAMVYSGGKVINIHGEDWSYGHRWNDPTLFEELAEMIRQAPEVRKERDELLVALKAIVDGCRVFCADSMDIDDAAVDRAIEAINKAER